VTQKPPDVRLEDVLLKYSSNVIDVRAFEKEAILQATDTSVIKSAKTDS